VDQQQRNISGAPTQDDAERHAQGPVDDRLTSDDWMRPPGESLRGKTVLVTGASSGIGAAIALACAGHGADVIVNYLGDPASAEDVCRGIRALGRQAETAHANVADSSDVTRMMREAVARFGKVDVLVNNAGIESQTDFLDKSEAEWDRTLAVNLKGPFLCSQAFARAAVERHGGGTIINISSVHEDLAFPGYADYCAAKGGLRMLCRDLALELAPHGINVVNVAPGAIATPINAETLDNPDKRSALEQSIPQHRIGSPREVALLVAYLASDVARYITGTTITIDGGLMRQTGSL
jgi:glucose 1-dehydrogenase